MSKIRCKCGYTIVDQMDNIPYKGEVIPDQNNDELFEKLTEHIDSLIQALRDNKREEWIDKNFLPGYPKNLKESSMIYDKFLNDYMESHKSIYQCENCGRILIQVGKTNQFEFFFPESETGKDILKKIE